MAAKQPPTIERDAPPERTDAQRAKHEARLCLIQETEAIGLWIGEQGRKHPDDPPRATSASWVRLLSKRLRDQGVASWYLHDDIRDEWDLVSALLGELLERDFPRLLLHRLEVRLCSAAWSEKDIEAERVIAGKLALPSAEERAAWPESDPKGPPLLRLKLSIPALLLATTDQIERALHELLVQCDVDDDGNARRRKPDLVAYTPTLARYGVTDARGVRAVAAAVRHSETRAAMERGGFDPTTGQGLLPWAPLAPRQPIGEA